MYYTIYKITNQIDGKIYIGSHKTKNLNDDYMGSGKYLKFAQEKHGIENFKKEILFVFDTAEEMYAKESALVNEEFLATKNTYNLKVGGFGGWDYINLNDDIRIEKNRRARKNADDALLKKYGVTNPSQLDSVKKKLSAAMHKRISEGYVLSNLPSFQGKKHTTETKRKMSMSLVGKQAGDKNSQYGTKWITDGNINKKIKKGDLMPEGFREGKIQKRIVS